MFSTSFSIKDAIHNAKEGTFLLHLMDQKNKPKGRLYLNNLNIKSVFSFCDLYTKMSMNIVQIIAVDFSLANLTFDET